VKTIYNFYQRHAVLFNLIFLLFFLSLFLFSLELMGTSLKMFGEGFAETLIENTTNPLVGLFIGILATSIIQSSSTTTSIVVGLVAAGALNIANAIPIIMGANIGTSVTNTLVSLTQIRRETEFRRALSAATVHDFFNVLAVLVLFPLQYFTNFLDRAAVFLGGKFQDVGIDKLSSPIKTLTKPPVEVLKGILENYPWILLVLSLILLVVALTRMVKSLKVLVIKKAEAWFDRVLFKTAFRALLVGLLLTAMVQSSSITTSLAVPMAGAGLLTLAQIFPYTLGANIGTTVTAIIAAIATGNLSAIIVAFTHLLFNISGIIVWWPFKIIPIRLAEKFAGIAVKYKITAILYIIVVFFLVPLAIITILR
jgi:sodium-dependent phosphate cotransporter